MNTSRLVAAWDSAGKDLEIDMGCAQVSFGVGNIINCLATFNMIRAMIDRVALTMTEIKVYPISYYIILYHIISY
jgi:hypothetical protein